MDCRTGSLALQLFRRASRDGHASALTMLGRCYEAGQGTRADAAKAAQLFTQVPR